MKKHIILVQLLLICGICNSQNLIPNGDFEQHTGCPGNLSQLSDANYWIQPSTGTADYFNQCANNPISNVPITEFGFQIAHSGGAFAGIRTWTTGGINYREYIETPFSSIAGSSLVANECYHFQMYVNLCNHCKYNSNDIGVYFSDTLISGVGNWNVLPYVPQLYNNTSYADTLNWMLISGNYTAHGGESYLIIGNFKSDVLTDTTIGNPAGNENMAYFYFDDVSLVP